MVAVTVTVTRHLSGWRKQSVAISTVLSTSPTCSLLINLFLLLRAILLGKKHLQASSSLVENILSALPPSLITNPYNLVVGQLLTSQTLPSKRNSWQCWALLKRIHLQINSVYRTACTRFALNLQVSDGAWPQQRQTLPLDCLPLLSKNPRTPHRRDHPTSVEDRSYHSHEKLESNQRWSRNVSWILGRTRQRT